MPEPVRVRFAPSPTGHLHVGGARTALFNWLFARHHGGIFILRIEDTDRSRSTEEYIDADRRGDALARARLGRGAARGRLSADGARRDLPRARRATPRRGAGLPLPLHAGDARRPPAGRARRAARPSAIPGTCRDADVPDVRAACAAPARRPREGQTVVEDVIHGDVAFDNALLDDWILVRTDGTPTYNFCNVVDDVSMKITHVIRGNDHLSNTPKQIQCYDALGYPVPRLRPHPDDPRRRQEPALQAPRRHVGAGLPRRRDPPRGDGELPGAPRLVARRPGDLLARGPGPGLRPGPGRQGGRRLRLRQARVAVASLDQGTRRPRGSPPSSSRSSRARGCPCRRIAPGSARVVDTLKERAPTLVEMARQSAFYLRAPAAYEPEATAKFWKPGAPERYALLIRRLEAHEDMDAGLARAALPGSRRGARLQARRPGPAHADRAHGPHGEPADLRGHQHPRQGGDARAAPGGGRRLRGGSAVRTLWLARHGQSLSNAVRRFQGTQDIALSDLGRRQAVALSAGLRGRTRRPRLREPARPRPVDGRRSWWPSTACRSPSWTICASCRSATGRGARWRRSARCPAIPTRCWVRDPVGGCPPSGEPLDRVQARVVERHRGHRRRASGRRRRARRLSRRRDQRLPGPLPRPAAVLDLARERGQLLAVRGVARRASCP